MWVGCWRGRERPVRAAGLSAGAAEAVSARVGAVGVRLGVSVLVSGCEGVVMLQYAGMHVCLRALQVYCRCTHTQHVGQLEGLPGC